MTTILRALTSQFSFNDDFTCSEAYQKEVHAPGSQLEAVRAHAAVLYTVAPALNVINAMQIGKAICAAGNRNQQ